MVIEYLEIELDSLKVGDVICSFLSSDHNPSWCYKIIGLDKKGLIVTDICDESHPVTAFVPKSAILGLDTACFKKMIASSAIPALIGRAQ